MQGGRSLANPPPFSLQDLRDAIPAECFEKDTFRSFGERLGQGAPRATLPGADDLLGAC